MRAGLVIALDVGATKVEAAAVDDRHVIERIRHDEPFVDYEHALATIAGLVRALAGRHLGTRYVAASVAGFLARDRRTVLKSALLGWDGRSFADDLASRCGLPVLLENDGNAAAWGEYVAGCGRRADPFVLLTLGSGVGGGVIVNGKLVTGAHGVAGELGHVLAVNGGRQCPCGALGCLEVYGSGRALLNGYLRRLPASTCEHLTRGGQSLSALPSVDRQRVEQSFAADLETQQAAAVEALAELGEHVGSACVRLSRVVDPHTIAFGGGLSRLGTALLAAIAAGWRQADPGVAPPPELVLAQLGNDAALIGVVDLAGRNV